MFHKYLTATTEITAKQTKVDSFVLFPSGWVEYEGYGSFLMDEIAANQIISHIQKRGVDIVIDYEHASMYEGEAAPAAGWVRPQDISFDNDKGFIVKCSWTQKAEEYIKNREYRYVSPVFDTAMDNRIVYLHSIALTNTPRTNKLQPLAASLEKQNKKGETKMSFAQNIAKALGMEDVTDEDKIFQALQAKLNETKTDDSEKEKKAKELEAKYKTLSEKFEGVAAALGVGNKQGKTPEQQMEEVKAHISAIKMAYVPREEFNKLHENLATMQAEAMVATLPGSDTFAPAKKDALIKLAKNMPDEFKVLAGVGDNNVPTKPLDFTQNTSDTNKVPFAATNNFPGNDARYGSNTVSTVEQAEEFLLAAAEKYQDDNKDMSLEDALKQACMDNPQLAEMVYAP